jgi:hypothetical protein
MDSETPGTPKSHQGAYLAGLRDPRLSARLRRGDTYGLLFLLLLVVFATSIIGPQKDFMRVFMGLATGLTLVMTARVSRAGRSFVLLAWIGFGAITIATAVVEVRQDRPLLVLLYFVVTVAQVMCIPVILRRLFQHREVNFETVAGAVCVYVIGGLAMADLLITLSYVTGSTFLVADPSLHGPIVLGDYYYFSFLTLTTVGYGDVTAANSIGRALAMVEAVVGQVFLVTMVARLVSSAHAVRRRAAAQEEASAGGTPS